MPHRNLGCPAERGSHCSRSRGGHHLQPGSCGVGGGGGGRCFSFFSSSLPPGSSLTAGKGIRMRSSGPNHSLDSEKQNREDTC